LVLKSDGTLWAWGANGSGQLGDGNRDDPGCRYCEDVPNPIPVQVSNLDSVVSIAAGGYHNLAVKSDGTIWAWGTNSSGQLGDGDGGEWGSYRSIPVRVFNIDPVVTVAAGSHHNLVLRSDGTVWAWGANHFGQLGDGTQTDRLTPSIVSSVTDDIPPVTKYSIQPYWVNEDGRKYIKGYTVTLTATDNLSGVKQTFYRINNGEWNLYGEPFLLTGTGDRNLEFYSIDNHGNQEIH
jgi:hypothetical protein